jgi:hypothetical protein
MKKLNYVSMLLLLLSFSSANAGAMEDYVVDDDEPVNTAYHVEVHKDGLNGIVDLDLRIVDMGYRWVQDLNDNDANTYMRTFMTFGFTKKDTLRFGWNRMGISNPLQNGDDNVMFEFKHEF